MWVFKCRNFCQGRSLWLLAPGVEKLSYATVDTPLSRFYWVNVYTWYELRKFWEDCCLNKNNNQWQEYTNYKTNYLHQCIVLKTLFYTLKPSTHIKINFKITPTCFGPTGPSSGSTSFLSQSYHWSRISTLHCGSAAACLCEVLGYVRVPVSMCFKV